MRDEFSAGGQCTIINGKQLKKPYPHIVKEILANQDTIKFLLHHPDEGIMMGIHDFWDFPYDSNDLYNSWLCMIESCFKLNKELEFVPIRELLESNAKPY